MRTQATIIRDGNGIERESWSDMKDYFPSYEKFWATHIVPLRSAGTKTIRDGVEPTLEEIAMLHYSCYMNLCRAWKKAKDKEQLRFFPEIYANLVSASTLAIRLLKRFESLCSACDCEFQAGHDRELGAFTQKELKPYRNALHDPLSGYRKSLDGLFYVPKKEKFRKSDDRRIYPRWSETYHYATSEFVSINEQFEWDFKELCD